MYTLLKESATKLLLRRFNLNGLSYVHNIPITNRRCHYDDFLETILKIYGLPKILYRNGSILYRSYKNVDKSISLLHNRLHVKMLGDYPLIINKGGQIYETFTMLLISPLEFMETMNYKQNNPNLGAIEFLDTIKYNIDQRIYKAAHIYWLISNLTEYGIVQDVANNIMMAILLITIK